jgi:uncharacterized protein YegL
VRFNFAGYDFREFADCGIWSYGKQTCRVTKRSSVVPVDVSARYTVLVLDASGSMTYMNGKPLIKLKETARIFLQQIFEAEGNNYIALVTFSDDSVVLSDFVGKKDLNQLNDAIDQFAAWGTTNSAAAFDTAKSLLDAVAASGNNVVKNVVFMSDGIPDNAKDALEASQKAKNEGYYIYTLGFFHSIPDPMSERQFLKDAQNAGYYEITDPNELQFAFGQISSDIIRKSSSFTYASPISQPIDDETHDFEETYYYSDDYFKKDSSEYNIHLATMSLCLELSAWGSNDVGRNAGVDVYKNKSVNAQNLLKDLGESGIAIDSWFEQKPETDSIGVIAGSKDVLFNGENYTIIAVAVRGGGYEKEWASNFTLGKSGQHQGFSEAKQNIRNFC